MVFNFVQTSNNWLVLCDGCANTILKTYRHKCLRCKNFDLCSSCYVQNITKGDHLSSHPFQLLMGPHVDGFSGQDISIKHFTCPFCSKMNYSDLHLFDHVTSTHKEDTTEVICPVCVAEPTAHPDLTKHLSVHLENIHEKIWLQDNFTETSNDSTNGALPINSIISYLKLDDSSSDSEENANNNEILHATPEGQSNCPQPICEDDNMSVTDNEYL